MTEDLKALEELLAWLEYECVFPPNAIEHAERWTEALKAAIAKTLWGVLGTNYGKLVC